MQQPPNTIWFYHEYNLPYGCFSNFSTHPVNYKGRVFPTSEHAFQAYKYIHNPNYFEKIATAKTPGKCATLGRDRTFPIREDWEQIKDGIMRKIVYEKFTQHAELKQILLDTENKTIIEHTKNDKYWGDGGNGKGKNMLGITLMQVREQIRQEVN
jgi:ribA/ribD-fused uncharacterized protein